MAYFSSLLIFAYFHLVDSRLHMHFASFDANITTTQSASVLLPCFNELTDPPGILQEFGRVIDTGTGATGSGAMGPSNFGEGNKNPVTAGGDSGLPAGSYVENINNHFGHALRMHSAGGVERIGVFYCDTNTTDERNDHTRIQFIVLSKDANIFPTKRTVTINSGEAVVLEMQVNDGTLGLIWLHNGSPLSDCADQSSCNVSSAGIYECYYDGHHNLGTHGIMRVIARDCPAEMWDPASGCDKVCVECINGGVCDDKVGDCVCPPGIIGTHCETTCNEAMGSECGNLCGTLQRCRSLTCMPDPYGCSCVNGHHGNCDSDVCDSSHFGADCALDCHCASGGCHYTTGECDSGGCADGWSGYNCQYISSSIVYFIYEKVNSGEQTTLTCVIEAYPRPTESQIIIEKVPSSGLYLNFDSTIDLINHRVTTISRNVTVNTGEEYICIVSNNSVAGGTSGKSLPVEFWVPPALVKGPDIDTGATQVTVSWNPWDQSIDDGDGPVSMYRVYYSLEMHLNFTLFGETSRTNLTVTDLQDNTTYYFAVTAYRETTGWGDYSPSTPATTLCSVPEPVSNLKASEITAESVYLTWQQPTGTNCVVINYSIEHFLYNKEHCEPFSNLTGTKNRVSTTFNYTGLKPCAEYIMTVKAITGGGMGEEMVLNFTTKEILPGPVQNLDASEITAESVYLLWKHPTGTCCALIHYTIEYKLIINRDGCEAKQDVTGSSYIMASATSFNYTGLEPYSEYIMLVEANTKRGSGDKVALNLTTREAVPTGSPTDIEQVNQGLQNITFRWKPVECGKRRGKILTYEYQLKNANTSTIVASGSVPVIIEEITFDNLDPNYYAFRVKASTSVGSGEYSQSTLVLHSVDRGTNSSEETSCEPLYFFIGIAVLLVVIIIETFIITIMCIRNKLISTIKENKCEVSKNNTSSEQPSLYEDIEKYEICPNQQIGISGMKESSRVYMELESIHEIPEKQNYMSLHFKGDLKN